MKQFVLDNNLPLHSKEIILNGKHMKNKTNLILTAFLGLQILIIGPVIAEAASGIGSDEYGMDYSEAVLDSLHTQEPPEPEIMVTTYYAKYFHGRTTANGERYDHYAYSAAHKTLPFNSILRVTNPKNGKSVVVRVNDRGPFPPGRQLDLSYAAAKEIGMIRAGVIKTEVEFLPDDYTITEEQEATSDYASR